MCRIITLKPVKLIHLDDLFLIHILILFSWIVFSMCIVVMFLKKKNLICFNSEICTWCVTNQLTLQAFAPDTKTEVLIAGYVAFDRLVCVLRFPPRCRKCD